MKARDVVGKRIVEIRNETMAGDTEYHGPRVICTAIYLDDGTRIIAHCAETSDCPVGWIDAYRATIEGDSK